MNDRLITETGESLRRDLPAEITVDAGVVDEEVAGSIVGKSQFR